MDSALIPNGVKRCSIGQFALWIAVVGGVLLWGVWALLLIYFKGLNQTNMTNAYGFALWIWADLAVIALGGWAFFTGAIDLARVFMSGASAGGRIWHLISGIAGIVLGLIIMLYPADSILTILWLVGIYLIVLGFLRIITGVFAPASRLGPSANEPHPF